MIISKQQVQFCLRLSISVAILGVLFKVMHWPYPGIILIFGLLGIAVFYALRFSQKKPKTLLDYSRLFLLIFFLLSYSFRIFHLPYSYIFAVLTQLSFLVFVILYAREVLFSKEETTENDDGQIKISTHKKAITYLLYTIAALGILIGSLFKILHWEFGVINGGILLIIGLLAAAISVLIDFK